MHKISSSLAFYIYALSGVILLIITGGGTNVYSEGFAFAWVGVGLILFPIKSIPGYKLTILLSLLFVWIVGAAFLPFNFLRPDWFSQAETQGLKTHFALSIHPSITLEKSIFFITGLCWLLLCMGNILGRHDRYRIFKYATIALGSLGLIVVAGLNFNFQHPLTWGTHKFSFFPNHNQNGIVLAIGAILAMGLLVRAIRRKEWKGALYFIIVSVITLALMQGMSRGALLALGLGVILILLLTMENQSFSFYVKVGLPLILVFASFFIIYGQSLLFEFISLIYAGTGDEEIRFQIYKDTFAYLFQNPWLGVGIGNFRYVFPFMRENTLTPQSVHHPESDFLWIWGETGLPGLILVCAALVLLVSRLHMKDLFFLKGLRLIGFIAFAVFLVSALIEVSGHRLGTVMLAILIYGMIQSDHAEIIRISFLPILSRFVGICLMVTSTVWLLNDLIGWDLKTQSAIDVTQSTLETQFEHHSPEELQQVLERYAEIYPFMSSIYQMQGLLHLYQISEIEEVDQAFQRASFLRPNDPQIFLQQGIAWINYDHRKAVNSWYNALNLSENRQELFRRILIATPEFQLQHLRPLTLDFVEVRFSYFRYLKGFKDAYLRQVNLELAVNPTLEGFSSEQKELILLLLTQYDDQGQLGRLITNFPILGSENWSLKAYAASNEGNYQEASRLAMLNIGKPEMIDLMRGRTYADIRSDYLSNSEDVLKIIALIQKLEEEERYDEAEIIIKVAYGRSIENAYLEYMYAKVSYLLGNYEDSWKIFSRIIHSNLDWQRY